MKIPSNFFIHIFTSYFYLCTRNILLSIHFAVSCLFFILSQRKKNGNSNCIFIVCPRAEIFAENIYNANVFLELISASIGIRAFFTTKCYCQFTIKIVRSIINCQEWKNLFFLQESFYIKFIF